VVVPAGVYLIPSQSNGRHLNLDSLTNFEIDATGATFVFQDVTATGLFFSNCDSVYFHGAAIYFATPPFSQGVIQAVAPDRTSLDVQIEKGYPTNLDDPKYFSPSLLGHLFDSGTRLWKKNVYGDVFGTRTQRLDANTFRIFTSSNGGAAAGDLIGIRTGVGDHAIRVVASSRMVLANLTILNSPNFAIAELASGDKGQNQYNGITVKRGNRAPGAATDPLFSTSADGIHSVEARKGPLIQNCNLESMADDGIAVHGHYSWVMQASGNTIVVSNTSVEFGANFRVGDTLRLYDANNGIVGDAMVTSVSPLPNFTNLRKSARTTIRDFTAGPYYQITLDRVLPAGFDYLAANPAGSGDGFVIQNNNVLNHRARGINVKADHGLVQGNTIQGSTMAGIWVGPDNYFGESGYSRNLILRNNTIRNVAYWSGQAAALLILPDQGPAVANAYQNLTIDGNTFENFDTTAILLTSVTGATVTNNVFRNLQNSTPSLPFYYGWDVPPGTLVFAGASSAVQFQGNAFSQLGDVNSGFVAAASSSIQGITYLSSLAGSSADFSGTQGAHNWFYGYFPGGNVNAFTQLPMYNTQSNQWQHNTFGPPWTLLAANSRAHPNGTNDGAEEWAVRRWVSQVAALVRISGHLAKNDVNPAGTGVFGRIYLNQSLIYEHFLTSTDGIGVDYVLTAQVKPGDTLDFGVAPNKTDSYDSTTFSAYIAQIAGTGPYVTSVSNAASGQAGIAPATYVSIYGVNFAAAGLIEDWSRSVVNGKLPTSLGGASVSIGGVPAYIVAVTSNQINVLTPALPNGVAPVTVTTSAGPSFPFHTVVQSTQPSLFLWPASQVVATHLDYSYAVKSGTFGGTSTPAKPGETIVLWGTGLGATSPAAPDGQVIPPAAFTVDGVSVSVGGETAHVLGAALAPGLAGVCQIAVQMPASLANGDYPVVVSVNGVTSESNAAITLHQ
jgi:uncharacterized protein (TIGR03437 family)